MPSSGTFQQAARVQVSLLTPVEKKVLVWLAERMPEWVNSDHLTALGFVSMLAAGAAYWHSSIHAVSGLMLVNLFLILNWFGDSLDGTLARVRNRQRPRYGFYLDHILDAIATSALIGGLGFSGFMSERVALLLLIVFLLLSIEAYLATYTIGKFKMAHGLFGPTELRVLLMIGNLVLLFRPYSNIFGRRFLLFDVGGVVAIIGMGVMLLRAVWRHGSELYKEEKLP